MEQGTLSASEKRQEAAGGDGRPYPAPDPVEGVTGPQNGSERLTPMESFREAAIYLRRPFTPEAIKWKVQSNFGEKGCLVVGYIDARLVVERLNLLVPHLWYDQYAPLDSNFLRCDLTVDGITRADVGQGSGKTGYSDALKRAAVKFGVGVSLYAIPRAELWLDQHGKYISMRRYKKRGSQEESFEFRITPAGDAALRLRYAKWLTEVGVPSFGEPLDHGDVVGAVGDADVAPSEQAEPEAEVRQLVEGPEADTARAAATALYEELTRLIPRSEYPPAQFQAGLEAHGDSLARLGEFVDDLTVRLENAKAAA